MCATVAAAATDRAGGNVAVAAVAFAAVLPAAGAGDSGNAGGDAAAGSRKVRRPAEGRSKNNNAVFVAFQSCLRSGHFRKSCLTANHPGIRVQRRKLLRSLVAVFWQRPCTAADACSLTDPEWHRPIQAPGGQHNATHASPICRRPPADRPRKTCCRNGTQQLAAVGTMVQP